MPPVNSEAATLLKYCALSEWFKVLNGSVLYCKARKNRDLIVLREKLAAPLFVPITSCELERLFSVMKAKEVNSGKISSENLQKMLFLRLIQII